MKTNKFRANVVTIVGFLIVGIIALLLAQIQSGSLVAAGNTTIDQRFPPSGVSGITPIQPGATPAPGTQYEAYSAFQYSLNGGTGTFRYEFLQTQGYPYLVATNRPWSFTTANGLIGGQANGDYNGHINSGVLVFDVVYGTDSYLHATGVLTATARPDFVIGGQPYMILTGSISIPDTVTPTFTPTHLPIATVTPEGTPAPPVDPTAVNPSVIPRSYFPLAQRENSGDNRD